MRDDRFEWNDDKAASNNLDHGVTFEVARQAFNDPLGFDEPNDDEFVNRWLDDEDEPDDEPEERWQWIGCTANGRMLFVVYTLRSGNDGRTRIRIISARKANANEQARYNAEAKRAGR